MYSTILSSISALIGVVGTVYSVLSILGLTIQDVFKSITLAGMNSRDEELLVQREQAKTGIPLVILGWVGQTVFALIKVSSCKIFLIALCVLMLSVIVEVLITRRINKRFRQKYETKKQNKSEDTHMDDHSWGCF